MKNFKTYGQLYQHELFARVIPFWLDHSVDPEGGYFTCLDRDGRVFDTDKFIWLQGRAVWMLSTLYRLERKEEKWLDYALHGADFLEKYGRAEDNTWYFSLDRAGNPLVQPYNIFSDCFATQAFGSLYQATGIERYADIARETFQSIMDRRDNPKRSWNKTIGTTRPLKNFALPMILCNLSLEIEPLLEHATVDNLIATCIDEVMEQFYHTESGLILENVSPTGQFIDCFEGRLLNPGHAIEAMWFIMDLGVRRQDAALIEKAKDRTLFMLEQAWDPIHGGLFYFMDLHQKPVQQLEWDQKLWWVHIETLIALLKAYKLTRDERCWTWFEKLHNYTWSHFPDPEFGEWFGYLNRQGEPLLPIKGGKWKGAYHVPRGLYHCAKTLQDLEDQLPIPLTCNTPAH